MGDYMKKLAVGIMSGTSLDGIDIVITEIEGTFTNTTVNVVAFETVEYEEKLLNRIKKSLVLEESSSDLLCSLNFELGYAYADAVKKVCKNNNFDLEEIAFIASHGQTIFHIGKSEKDNIQSSLQLGEGSVIANECNTTVVSNFRSADIAVGGQGAPLVPYADYILFSKKDKTRVMHNIGGISNVTVLKKNGSIDDVLAFDTGLGNMMID
ncbi:MAG: anhydro-N-acetylmuramic acid kinase, partial [Candidatus Izimaplasma sp.]|nr:anhydro-N-acetylmuramic acid kinase [Candidatus Izimaplasma bacterium]